MHAFVVFLLFILLQCCGVADGAFSTVVDSGEEECFVVKLPKGETSMISGNYDVLEDDLSPAPIGVILYNDKMTPVWKSGAGASEGNFKLYGSGKYELCFQNGRIGNDDFYAPKDGFKREIGFSIRVTPPSRSMDNGMAGPEDRLNAHLLEMSHKLMDGMHNVLDHQEYMRERENRHSKLADATFSRVVQWTVLEAVVLALISLGQVLYLKKFFEQRRYL